MSGSIDPNPKLPPLKIVYIRWKDAMHSMNQHPVSELGELAILHEIGFLLKETPDTIVIGTESEQTQSLEARMWLTIPRANIVEIRSTTLSRAFPAPRRPIVKKDSADNL